MLASATIAMETTSKHDLLADLRGDAKLSSSDTVTFTQTFKDGAKVNPNFKRRDTSSASTQVNQHKDELVFKYRSPLLRFRSYR